ncbi:MAG: metalloregulator ArsR/SmtB family transcription factor [Gemmatimonadaceae bacterium]|nr:metalloregulator ArsR/SmtB family transcription factor [Gemmatimonadaceae bacterium]
MTTASTHLSTLADPTRSRLLLVLERHELTVGELCVILQLPQSTISRHLKVLGDDGWVSSRADGTSRFYRMTDPTGEWTRRLWEVVRDDVERSSAAAQDRARETTVVADRRRRSREYFSTVAGQWSEVRRALFGSQVDLHVALALLDPTSTVGDLGCGEGQFAERLAPHVARVIAVDASVEMLAAARGRLAAFPNVDVRQSDLERLPIEAGTLDTAICSLVLHYVAEPGRVLAEAWRALRPGGRLLIVDMTPHDRDELRHTMGHAWTGFSEQQLRAWTGEAGFSNVQLRTLPSDADAMGPALFLLTAVKP